MTLIEVYRESKELKRLVVERSIKYKIPLRYICRELNLDYTGFMLSYINSADSHDFNITDEKMTQVLDILGITVRFNFVINKDFTFDTRRDDVERWIKEGSPASQVEQNKPKGAKKERNITEDQ